MALLHVPEPDGACTMMTAREPDPDLSALLAQHGCVAEPCGSRTTCRPPPMDTDSDWLVYLPGRSLAPASKTQIADLDEALHDAGFVIEGGGEHYQTMVGSDFCSYRRGVTNLIVTARADFAERHRLATALCTSLNTMVKGDRIKIFQAILYERVLP